MMIQRIRNSRAFKGICMLLALNIVAEIVSPMRALALTGGPAQPEFGSFTPAGTSDMVDLSSGDMNYNIPLMDVGGYPLNLAYSSGVGMDDEASWVGLGWNLSVGQINRSVRGLPDDFKGDEMTYENNIKPNVTVGVGFKFTTGIFGVSADGLQNDSLGNVSYGVTVSYNNYQGFTMQPSIGVQASLGDNVSVGFNAVSGPDGLTISPNASIHKAVTSTADHDRKLGANFGVSMNSRQGLTSTSLRMTSSAKYKGKFGNNANNTIGTGGSQGSSIGFTDMLYTPYKRTAMVTGSFTVNAALGTEFFGGEGQGQITAFGTVQKIKPEERESSRKAYGYAHTQHGDNLSILDFNREKDGSFSVNTTNLPITNYTYDIYSVQGQGVSGMYRPYRNQVGFVYDPLVRDGSFSGSLGLEFGVGNAAHFGMDIESTDISSHSGEWKNSNTPYNKFKSKEANPIQYEPVHYKNVGDLSTDQEFSPLFYSKLGGYQPARIPFVGQKFYRSTENKFHAKMSPDAEQVLNIDGEIKRNKRQLRNQAIHNVTIKELQEHIGYGPLTRNEYTLPADAKGHHTGEVQILRNDGARYIYGLPVYNLVKKEATFAVGSEGNCSTGIVEYTKGVDNSINNKTNNRYFERVTTPAYVHTYLLTSVLSTDYSDRTNNGPSEDDLGSYTAFSYEKKHPVYKWRVPLGEGEATFNEGLKSDQTDNQGSYVYGEKEVYYLKTIRTKTHVAIFKYKDQRDDGKGVKGEDGGIDPDQKSYALEKISLYSVKEYNNGAGTPIKEVHFKYNYSLCQGVLNNSAGGGKLTLEKVYFTYRDSRMGKYTGYKFNYDNANPVYNVKGYDSWGNYKRNAGTCDHAGTPVTAPEYPFVDQDAAEQDINAAAWSLSSVELPSGGKILIKYESDDYAYVQNKAALRMFKVVGAGTVDAPGSLPDGLSDVLYDRGIVDAHKKYLYVQVPEQAAITDQNVIKNKYLTGLDDKVYFRFLMNMTLAGSDATTETQLNAARFDYVTGYAELDKTATSKVFQSGGHYYLSVPIKRVKREGGIGAGLKVNPVSKAAWHFGRKYLNKHVYSTQDNGDSEDILAIVNDILSPGVLENLEEIFTGPNATLENKGIGRRFILEKSWIRLKEPKGRKLGGGCRVRTIEMSDVWGNVMNAGQPGYQTMSYGQVYEYKMLDGRSSGVATYEPVGNKENPFVQPVYSTTEHLLAPDDENFMEMPFGESFFPNPQVTYSRVSVSNMSNATNPGHNIKKLHRTGHVVTEFYTTKDYPTIVDQTIMQAEEDQQQLLDNLLSMNVRKHMTASQGYVVHLNDMNGKQKSQRVYAAGQNDFISGVDYRYDNYSANPTLNAQQFLDENKGKLNNLVRVIYPNGAIRMETIGVEYDVVNDFRENMTSTDIAGVNTNLASFLAGIIVGMIPIPLPDQSHQEDQFRSVSTTKVINTFGILKETVAYDAGATVYTRNLAWDALTGEVLVTETIDEFDDKYYSLNYPAHWYYPGMGQAAMNLGLQGNLSVLGVGTYGIQGQSAFAATAFLTEGDEIVYGTSNLKAWVVNIQGNNFGLMDASGNYISNASGAFKVTRSGRRNLQSAGIMNVTLKRNPLLTASGGYASGLDENFLVGNTWNTWKIINAGAVDYSDSWKASCECGTVSQGGIYNPYVVNEKGVWRTKSSRTYLTGRFSQAKVTPRMDGYFTSFSPFYKLTGNSSWQKDMLHWTFVSEVSRYSPYGFEMENKDALGRHSAAQYGYNNTFPMAVGANTRYTELGYDGFEDYGFTGCATDPHFSFNNSSILTGGIVVSPDQSHTGKSSLLVPKGKKATLTKKIACPTNILSR